MKIGFTGTQNGMTISQRNEVNSLLSQLDGIEFHHGDCIGADAQSHEIATKYTSNIHLHIPLIHKKRAFMNKTGSFTVYPPKPYLERNHDIVDSADLIIATPKEEYEIDRSGTWATKRYAKKKGKHVIIIYPTGRKEECYENRTKI